MTVRESLTQKKRPPMIIFFAGLIVFGLGLSLTEFGGRITIVALAGFVMAFGALVYLLMGLSCPKCKGRLGQLIMSCGWSFRISSKLKFCPYCGVQFDEPA